MRSRAWVFTINNYTDDDIKQVKEAGYQYVVYGKEIGEQGTPHLQGYMYFKTARTLKSLSKKLKRANLQIRRGSHDEAKNYCIKDGDFVEDGIEPEKNGGDKTQERIRKNKRIREKTLNELVDEGIISFHDVRKIKNAKLDLAQEGDAIGVDEVRGEWYYGLPGTGKSYTARKNYPEAYIKAQNKWFDGYIGQQSIILDDLDTNVLGHYLKIWSDRYPCTGEVKGGQVNLKHKKFIVTSNYHPDELFEDVKMCEAIKRRFKITHFNKL